MIISASLNTRKIKKILELEADSIHIQLYRRLIVGLAEDESFVCQFCYW